MEPKKRQMIEMIARKIHQENKRSVTLSKIKKITEKKLRDKTHIDRDDLQGIEELVRSHESTKFIEIKLK